MVCVVLSENDQMRACPHVYGRARNCCGCLTNTNPTHPLGAMHVILLGRALAGLLIDDNNNNNNKKNK